jgi:hypothetical protein
MNILKPYSDISKQLIKCRQTTHKKEFNTLLYLFETNKISVNEFIKKLKCFYNELDRYTMDEDEDMNKNGIFSYTRSFKVYILASRFYFKNCVLYCYDLKKLNKEENNKSILDNYYLMVHKYMDTIVLNNFRPWSKKN